MKKLNKDYDYINLYTKTGFLRHNFTMVYSLGTKSFRKSLL